MFTDCINYYALYQSDIAGSFSLYSEIYSPLFLLEVIIFQSIGSSYWFWIFMRELLLSAILFEIVKINRIKFIYFLLAFMAYRGTIIEFNLYQNNVSLYLLYYFFSMTGVNRILKMLGIFVSFLYHFTAILLLPIGLIIRNIFVSHVLLAFVLILSIMVPLLPENIYSFGILEFLKLLPQNVRFALEILLENSSNYSSLYGFLERTTVLVLIIAFSKKSDTFNSFVLVWYIVYVLFAFADIIVDRIGLLFLPALWIVLARTMQRAEKSRVHIALIVLCMMKLGLAVSNPGSEYKNILFSGESFEEAKIRIYSYLDK